MYMILKVHCADITYNMAGTTLARAVGFFMAICVLYASGSSQSVPDGQVYTEVKKTLVLGFPGVLTCRFLGDPVAVYWEKSSDSEDLDRILVWHNGEVSGPRYDDGSCDIDENYSLIIKNVSLADAGRIYCTVSNYRGILINNYTDVFVAVQPREPFPTILECLHRESNLSYCSIPDETESTLTCQVSGYYPDINLIFLYGSRKVEILRTREQNNTDGTKNKTITIAALGSKELYTCVAFNIPGTPVNRSTSALLHDHDDREHFNRVVLVPVLICFAALILFSLMAYFIWRRKHRHSDSNYTEVGQVELQCSRDKDVKELTDKEKQTLLEHVNDVMMKHYTRIYDLIYTKSIVQAEKIIDENRTSLFDTEQMLEDWRQNPESTYRQYMKAMQVAISPEDKSDNVWPFNGELKWISNHLDQHSDQKSMKEICRKLKITCKPQDTNDERKWYTSLHALREWKNKVALESVEKKHNQLSSAVTSKNLKGLLPPLKGHFIYKAELVDMAFDLLMEDLLPITEVLGINATKLVSYRPAFQSSHLEMGTIDLLSKFLNSVDKEDIRIYFYGRIGGLTHYNVTARGLVAYDMSYGEMYAISEAMPPTKQKATGSPALPVDTSGDTSKAPTLSKDDKYQKGAASTIPEDGNKEETDIENPESKTPLLVVTRDRTSETEKAAKNTETKDTESKDQRTGILRVFEISEDLFDLLCALQLTDQDIADGFGSSNPITAHALFEIWKEKPRPSVFNFRAAFAHGLHGIHLLDLADAVIAGKYITEQTSLTFIQNMVQGLSQDELKRLGKILNLSRKDEHWHTRTPFAVISKQICEWVGNWTKQIKKSRDMSKLTSTSEKHRDLNDKLVENGFLDLAREIMIIEQQME